jgi:hypothetical protein
VQRAIDRARHAQARSGKAGLHGDRAGEVRVGGNGIEQEQVAPAQRAGQRGRAIAGKSGDPGQPGEGGERLPRADLFAVARIAPTGVPGACTSR